jgi:CHAD domain-containing protein
MKAKFPGRLAVHLAGSVHAARRRYRKRLARCRKKFSESAVHELRVEARRILALLDLLEALRFGDSLKKLAKNFKKRLDTFDELRDTQVQQRLLRPMWRDFPEARRLKSLLQRREERLASKLDRKLQAAKYARLTRRLKELEKGLLRAGKGDSARKTSDGIVSGILREAFLRLVDLRRQVRREDAATIHRLRVCFKRFRYMNELLQPLLPGLTAQRLERMKEYQAAAGDIQDLEVLLARLARALREQELKRAEIENLRIELLRRKRRAIDSFLTRVDDLFDFQTKGSESQLQTG